MATDYEQFIGKIKQKTGIDLALYKEAQMQRRLRALRDKRGFADYMSYFHALTKEESFFNEFLDRMTINVSEFYRNARRWEVLDKKIIPRLLRENRKLKLWSAACSTGEEPYTLAMVMAGHIPLKDVSILATDIDQQILERAKVGIYSDRSIKEVPTNSLSTYFEKVGMGYKVKPEVKATVRFQKQNLLADPFIENVDLIICRNVMIYFTEEAKHELYHKFSCALRPGGVLFVGSTEQIFNASTYGFETEDTFFYRKKES